MEQYEKEIERFVYTKDGTKVWVKRKGDKVWGTMTLPLWKKDHVYITDDKYAELRMESEDTSRSIQVYNLELSKWETPKPEDIKFNMHIEFYRLEPINKKDNI